MKLDMPDPLNEALDIEVNANSFTNPLFPKAGKLFVGDKGIEFRGSASGFIQMPWENIDMVRADVYGKYVRSIECVCNNKMNFSFTVSDGADLLRCINKHIGRGKICSAGRNLERMAKGEKGEGEAKGIKKLGSLFSRKKK